MKNAPLNLVRLGIATLTRSVSERSASSLVPRFVERSPSLTLRVSFCFLIGIAVSPSLAEPPIEVTPPKSESVGLRRFEFRRTLMGVPFAAAFYACDEVSANKAIDAVWARVEQLNSVMSDYDSASELMRLCRDSGPGKPIRVSPELFFVLNKATQISEASNGAFDVTVGPLVKLWRRARRQKEMPDAKQLAEARAVAGWKNVRLRCEDCSVELLKPGIKLDLGGIAVGYAADEAIKLFKQHGISRAMIDGSGDIVVSDPPPGETGWRIGIASLKEPDAASTMFATLANGSISTSGDAYQFVELGGKRYSHIVDPQTGLGLTDRHSVTVIAPDGITADSLATAVCVLGPERGLKLIESQPKVAALFATLDGERLNVRQSAGFVRHLQTSIMPTIHRQDGFRLMIYPNDHAPAHVHCVRGSSQIVLNLADGGEGPTLRQANRHTKFNDLGDAVRIVNENHFKLWDAWDTYHG